MSSVFAMSVIDQITVLDAPMLPHVGGPIGVLLGALLGVHREVFPVVEGVATTPAGEVPSIEEGLETDGRLVRLLRRDAADESEADQRQSGDMAPQ